MPLGMTELYIVIDISEVPNTMPSFIAELYLNLMHSKVMANRNIQV